MRHLAYCLFFLISICHATPATVASGGTSALPRFDLNGDAKSDLVLILNDGVVDLRQLLASSGDAFQAMCEGTDDNACGIDSGEAYMRDPDTRIIAGDFDGLGRSDLLVISADPAFPRRALLASNGTSFTWLCHGEAGSPCGIETSRYLTDPLTRLLPGDFNGDGKTDVLVIAGSTAAPWRKLLLSTGTGFVTACSGMTDGSCGFDTEPYMFDPLTKLLTGDFNGDARTDVLVISGDPAFPRRALLTSSGSSFVEACVGNIDGACGFDTEPYMFSIDTKVIPGDFNGDASTDVLVVSGDPTFPRRALLLANGAGFVEACVGQQDGACGFDTEPYMFHANTRLIAGDFAGDPRTDILVVSGDKAFPRRMLLAATGSVFAEVCVGQHDGACGLDTEPYMFNHLTREFVGNFDGLGRDDLFVLSGDPGFPRGALLISHGAGFGDAPCVASAGGMCGVNASFLSDPWDTRELPRHAHNFPARQLASTFKSEPDITRSLRWATRSGAVRVELDGPSGSVHESGPIFLRSHQTLAWHPGVILRAKLGAFPGLEDAFITIRNSESVRVEGASNAQLTMRKNDYHDGEWRHGVRILSSHDVTISNLRIADSGGDGIYVSDSGDFSRPSTAVVVSGVDCSNNSRNGLSVINADGLEVANSVFSLTRSMYPTLVASDGPQAGIDFEPNDKRQQLRNILVRDVAIHDNTNFGVLFALGVSAEGEESLPYPQPVTIDLERVTITGAVPKQAVVKFNEEAMTQIPPGSRIRLTDLQIDVGPTNGLSLRQMINGTNFGISPSHTCGFGVRSSVPYVCNISGGIFVTPTRPANSWLANFFIH